MGLACRILCLSLLVVAGCTDQPFTIDVPIRVVSVEPSGAASGVARDAVISVSFSENLDAASVVEGNFFVERLAADGTTSEETLAGTIAYDSVGFVSSFDPDLLLDYSRFYRVTLTTGLLRERDGGPLPIEVTSTFQVEHPPPLAVTATVPGAAATEVPRTATLEFVFSEPVNCAVVDSAHIVVEETFDAHPHLSTNAGQTLLVAGSFACTAPNPPSATGLEDTSCVNNNDACRAVFTPSAPFAYSSAISVTLKGGVRPDALESARATDFGGQLPADVLYAFDILDPPELLVAATAPSDIGVSAARDTDITLVFSDEVDCSGFTANTVDISETLDALYGGTTATVTAVIDCVGPTNTVTLTPAQPFSFSSSVTVTLRGGAFGDDNPLAYPEDNLESAIATTKRGQLGADLAFTFQVRHPPSLELVSATPGNGAAGIVREDLSNNPTPFVLTFSEGLLRPASAVDDDLLGTNPSAADGALYIEDVTGFADPYDLAVDGAPISGAVSFNDAEGNTNADGTGTDNVLTFTPAAVPLFATLVRMTLRAELPPSLAGLHSDRVTTGGGQLNSTKILVFAIEPPPPFFVTFTSPSDRGENIANGATTVITVEFSEGVDCSTFVAGTSFTAAYAASDAVSPGGAIGGSISPGCVDDDVQVTLAPGVALGFSRDVEVALTTALGSLAAGVDTNPAADPTLGHLVAPDTFVFTTEHPPVAAYLGSNVAAGIQVDPGLAEITVVFAGIIDAGTVNGSGPTYTTYGGADILDSGGLRSNTFFIAQGPGPGVLPLASNYDPAIHDPRADAGLLDLDRVAALGGANDVQCDDGIVANGFPDPCDWSAFTITPNFAAGTTTVSLAVPRILFTEYFYRVTLATEICRVDVNANTPTPQWGCLPQVVQATFQIAPTPPLRVVSTVPPLTVAADGSLLITSGVSVTTEVHVTFNNLVQAVTTGACGAGNDSLNCDIAASQDAGVTPNLWINQGQCAGIGSLAGECDPATRLALGNAGAGPDWIDYAFPTARMVPAAALVQDTAYTVTATRDVLDQAGGRLASHFHFTFSTSASTYVLGSLPTTKRNTDAGPTPVTSIANNINSGQVTVCFTEAMAPATIDHATLHLTYDDENGQTIVLPGAVTYSNTNTDCSAQFGAANTFGAVIVIDFEALASCNSLSPTLPYDTEYTIHLSSRVHTLPAGTNVNIPEQKYLFRTGTDPLFDSVVVSNGISGSHSILPASVRATEVPVNSWIVVSFQEPIDFATVDAITFRVLDGTGADVPGLRLGPGGSLPGGGSLLPEQIAFIPDVAPQRDGTGALTTMTPPSSNCNFTEETIAYGSPTGLCYDETHTIIIEGRDGPSDATTVRMTNGNYPLGTVIRTFHTSPAVFTRPSPDDFDRLLALMSVVFYERGSSPDRIRPMDPGSINVDTALLYSGPSASANGTALYSSLVGFDRRSSSLTVLAVPNPASTGFDLMVYGTTEIRDYLGNPLPIRVAPVSIESVAINVGAFHAYPVSGNSACGPGYTPSAPTGATSISGNNHGHDPILVSFAGAVGTPADQLVPTSLGPSGSFVTAGTPAAVDCDNVATGNVIEATNTATTPFAPANDNDVIIRAVDYLPAGQYTVCVRDYVNAPCDSTNNTTEFSYLVEGTAPTAVSVEVQPEVGGPVDLIAASSATIEPESAVTITFGERIDVTTVTTGSASDSLRLVEDPAGAAIDVAGDIAWNAAFDQLVFTPGAPLSGGVTYEVRLTAVITDTAGNALVVPALNTFSIENGPPSLVAGATPSGGGVAQGQDIVFGFDEGIDLASVLTGAGGATLDTGAIAITADLAGTACAPGAQTVPACVTYDAATFTLTLDPAFPEGLPGGRSFAVDVVAPGVSDLGGTPSGAAAVTTFSTNTTSGAPSVLCVDYSGFDATAGITITIDFSEAITATGGAGNVPTFIYVYEQSLGVGNGQVIAADTPPVAGASVTLDFLGGTLNTGTDYGLVVESYNDGADVGIVAGDDATLLAAELFASFTTL